VPPCVFSLAFVEGMWARGKMVLRLFANPIVMAAAMVLVLPKVVEGREEMSAT